MKTPVIFGCVCCGILLLSAAFGRSQENPTQPASSSATQDSVPSDPVFKVGGDVAAPVLTYSRDPEYSDAARRARLEGTVLLTLIVGPDGSPRDVKVTRPLGNGLDEKAIEAIREWRFRPGTRDGKPVAVLLSVEVAFHLKNNVVASGEPISVVSAKYPKKARKQKVEGPVALHVTIAADGSVKDVAVVSGDSRLTDAAVAAVRQWRFQPFNADGKPVEGQRDITINFALSEDSVPLGPVFKVGDAGVTAPVLTYSRDPDYSEEARQARLAGTVSLSIVVAPDGSPRDIKVTRPLGSGLDEKAIEAIREWKFRPGTKDGQPVAVSLSVEVAFHLI